MMVDALSRRTRSRAGFTLLELVVAFAILAMFVLPVLQIVHEARIRAVRYSIKRQVQELAQRKLFDRIYLYSPEAANAGAIQAMSGTFAAEGHPDWQLEIPFPEIVNQGEQVLLQYTIRVYAPELGAAGAGDSTGGSSGFGAGAYGAYPGQLPSSFELITWTLPSEAWYYEQQELAELGIDTGYYPGAGYGGAGYGGAAGGTYGR